MATDLDRLLSYCQREFGEGGLVVADDTIPANYARHSLDWVVVPDAQVALDWYPRVRPGGVLAGPGRPPMLPGAAVNGQVWLKIKPEEIE